MTGEAGGKVYLIGAGPGDPGLLTVKGREILERADVVVYDYLANDALLLLCRPDAERLFVGKKGGRPSLSQKKISMLLVQKARSGATVARLKGGDPYIFGRGGEEGEVLAKAGIPFEVIPGISSAVAAPAYAGIPLTDRRYASSVAVVTGHEDPSKGGSRMRWEHLARGVDTLVFLMGVKNLTKIVENLIAHGRDPRTPAALIRWGTTSRQRTITAALEEIAANARTAGMQAPAVLVVGEVVKLRPQLGWFERAPLFGRTIVVTRSREQASDLVKRLRSLGAETVEFPTIQIEEPVDWGPADRAVRDLADYDWVLFSSPNGVRFFLRRLKERGGDLRDLKGVRIAAIGPGTAQALEDLGLRVDVMPQEYRAEALADAFPAEKARGKRFLLPRAEEAREVLPERLRAMGGSVDVVTAYRTVMPADRAPQMREMFEAGGVDAITFTSSSTVKNFVRMMGGKGVSRLLDGVTVVCIGPITARTAESYGIRTQVLARSYTVAGLVEALVRHFRRGLAPPLANDGQPARRGAGS